MTATEPQTKQETAPDIYLPEEAVKYLKLPSMRSLIHARANGLVGIRWGKGYAYHRNALDAYKMKIFGQDMPVASSKARERR